LRNRNRVAAAGTAPQPVGSPSTSLRRRRRAKPRRSRGRSDWDPSGQNAADNIEDRLREFAPSADINFNKLAVTPDQIQAWNLPSRPTKTSDSRSVTWQGGDSVEVDAIHPNRLRVMVRNAIEIHTDEHQIEVIRKAEESERELLRAWRPNGGGPPP
jgi:hypothetical protein